MGIATIQGIAPPQGFTTFSLESVPQYLAGWHAWYVDVTGNVITEFDSMTTAWDTLPAVGLVVLLVRFTGKYDGANAFQQVYSNMALTTLDPLPTFSHFGTLPKLGAVITAAQYKAVLVRALGPMQPGI